MNNAITTRLYFKLKVSKNNKTLETYATHSYKRFLIKARTINWQNGPISAYLKVSYGKDIDQFGKLSEFYNDGIYENDPKEFWKALAAFIEDYHQIEVSVMYRLHTQKEVGVR